MKRARPINSSELSYIKYQIGTGDSLLAKHGLQRLCELYRSGARIISIDDLNAVEQSIVGLLYTHQADQKLRRWALNAIAQLGRPHTTTEVVNDCLEKFSDDPETAAAAIAALFALRKDAASILKAKDKFPKELIALSGLQSAAIPEEELASVSINIEKADADLLKLSLITVGLEKAPEHIFHPRHTNSAIVKVLGRHDDRIVSQYSIWAITENSSLSIQDLGIELKDVEAQPANVRGWIYQLVGMSKKSAVTNYEYIRLGSGDTEEETRGGLARGLRGTYFDGLEALVFEWFTNEVSGTTRSWLIDHMVANSNKCEGYRELVLTLYEKEGPASPTRARMDAAAAGTALYGDFQRIKDSLND